MDNLIRIGFTAKPKHELAWQTILEGLVEASEAGIEFQDRMLEQFGEAVDEELEQFLETWGTEVLYLEGWEKEGNEFSFEIPATSDWEELIGGLREVFSLCPISALALEFLPDEDD